MVRTRLTVVPGRPDRYRVTLASAEVTYNGYKYLVIEMCDVRFGTVGLPDDEDVEDFDAGDVLVVEGVFFVIHHWQRAAFDGFTAWRLSGKRHSPAVSGPPGRVVTILFER